MDWISQGHIKIYLHSKTFFSENCEQAEVEERVGAYTAQPNEEESFAVTSYSEYPINTGCHGNQIDATITVNH